MQLLHDRNVIMTDWLTKRTKAYFTEATFAKKGRSSFFFYGGSLGHAYGSCCQIHWAVGGKTD